MPAAKPLGKSGLVRQEVSFSVVQQTKHPYISAVNTPDDWSRVQCVYTVPLCGKALINCTGSESLLDFIKFLMVWREHVTTKTPQRLQTAFSGIHA